MTEGRFHLTRFHNTWCPGQCHKKLQHFHNLKRLGSLSSLSSSSSSCITCLFILGYSGKTSNLISSSVSLSALLSFTIPGLPFCYSNSPSSKTLAHNMSCLYPYFLLIVVKMSGTLICSLIHNALFLPLNIIRRNIHSIPLWLLWSFHSRTFIYDPYVRIGTMPWFNTFLFSDSGRWLFITFKTKSILSHSYNKGKNMTLTHWRTTLPRWGLIFWWSVEPN